MLFSLFLRTVFKLETLPFRLEWCLQDLMAAKKLLKEATERYPETPKLYLMMGQIFWQEKNIAEARRFLSEGVCNSVANYFCREKVLKKNLVF